MQKYEIIGFRLCYGWRIGHVLIVQYVQEKKKFWVNYWEPGGWFCLNPAELTFQSDHQRYFQLELLAGFGDTIGYDGTVHNPTKYVYKDCFNL